MDPVKHGRRPARIVALSCVVAISLSSCAHRTASSVAATATLPAPETPGPQPRKPAAPLPRERKPSPQPIPPQPSKAEQIIALIREGRLVNESQGTLVFSKSGLTRSSRSGLYEDAILLARLRRTLKETAGIPEALSASATVRDARAFLVIERTLSASTAASAIDAGLRTPGIIAVQVRFGS